MSINIRNGLVLPLIVTCSILRIFIQGALFSAGIIPKRQTSSTSVKFSSQINEIYEEKPGWVHTCDLDDPEVDACLRDSVQQILYAIISGAAEESEVLDPLNIARAYLGHYYRRGVELHINFTSIACTGAKLLQVKQARYELENGCLHLVIHIPEIHLEGNYELQGQAVLLRALGNGSLGADFSGVKMDMSLQLATQDNGALSAHFVRLDINTQSLNLNVSGLYHQADPQIGAKLGETININALGLFIESREEMEEGLAHILQRAINSVFNRLPLSMWLSKQTSTAAPTTVPTISSTQTDSVVMALYDKI